MRSIFTGSALLAVLTAALNEPCKISNNRLDPNSHKFISDCGPTEYCAAISTFHNGTSNGPSPGLDKEDLVYVNLAGISHQSNGNLPKHWKAARKRADMQNVFLASSSSNSSAATAQTHNATETKQPEPAPVGNATATCQPKGCRRDEFPFGYGQDDILPPRCEIDEFCPDEEDECRPLVPLGSACQLNRDDECLPPSNATLLANENNFNGSICLSYTCMYADVELGNQCKIDNTVYSGYLPDGSQFTDIVSRNNCATGLYCSNDALRCETRLEVGQACTADSQCQSGNCNTNDLCVAPPETPSPLPRQVYVMVPLGILLAMTGMVAGLWKCHQKARSRRAKVMQEYWTEQMSYRRSILSMHMAAQKGQCREKKGSTRSRRNREEDDDGRSIISGTSYTSSEAPSSEASSEYDRHKRRRRERQ